MKALLVAVRTARIVSQFVSFDRELAQTKANITWADPGPGVRSHGNLPPAGETSQRSAMCCGSPAARRRLAVGAWRDHLGVVEEVRPGVGPVSGDGRVE